MSKDGGNSSCVESSNETETPSTCGICLDELSASTQAQINSCDHIFCFECILKWSKVGENKCPMCKKLFKKITTAKNSESTPPSQKGRKRKASNNIKEVTVKNKRQAVPYQDMGHDFNDDEYDLDDDDDGGGFFGDNMFSDILFNHGMFNSRGSSNGYHRESLENAMLSAVFGLISGGHDPTVRRGRAPLRRSAVGGSNSNSSSAMNTNNNIRQRARPNGNSVSSNRRLPIADSEICVISDDEADVKGKLTSVSDKLLI